MLMSGLILALSLFVVLVQLPSSWWAWSVRWWDLGTTVILAYLVLKVGSTSISMTAATAGIVFTLLLHVAAWFVRRRERKRAPTSP